MNLDPRLKRFIHEWEALKLKNQLFSKNLSMINNQSTNTSPDIADILYYLLYVNAPTLRDFFDKVEYCIQKTKQDKKHHNCCFVIKDFCLNFHSSINIIELDKHMLGYANLKKYQQEKDTVLSLGSYINDEDPFFINRSIILSFSYKKDPHLDKVLDDFKKHGYLKRT